MEPKLYITDTAALNALADSVRRFRDSPTIMNRAAMFQALDRTEYVNGVKPWTGGTANETDAKTEASQ